jgi:aerobic carbon-monoxide dehydrogenase large subunit
VTAARFMGQRVLRREDPRLLAGRGTFVDDVHAAGLLHAAFVRSHVARGRIAGLDVEEARAVDGVVAVLTSSELHPFAHPAHGPIQPLMPFTRVLAERDVRFVGEPIAVVVARDRYLAEDACDLVVLDVDHDRAIVDPEDALRDPTRRVHDELDTNVASSRSIGDSDRLDAVFSEAAHVVTETFRQQRHVCAPMEPHGILANWDPISGELVVWISTQMPHHVRLMAARLLGIGENNVRVIMRDVGGGFGQKTGVRREEVAILLATRALGRPVKWIEDRRENLMAAAHARGERMTVSFALDASARIMAARADHLEDSGAFPLTTGTGSSASNAGNSFPGPYRTPVIGYTNHAVYTNTSGRGPYRGPWMMETLAREQLVDIAARQLGIDPLELRRRNVVRPEDLPFTTGTGQVYDLAPSTCLEQAAQLIGYDQFRASQQSERAAGRFPGIGTGLYVEPSALAGSVSATETATVRVEPSGKVIVIMGSASHGHSLETTMIQVVADELGCDIDDVTLLQGDTAVAPFGFGTGGSRSAVLGGGAAAGAAAIIRERVVEIAAHAMEAAPADIEIGDGRVFVTGTPARSMTLEQVAQLAYGAPHQLPVSVPPGLEATYRYLSPTAVTWSLACHMCTCDVDAETGKVRLLRYVVSEDCGNMINPMVVEGQIAGGVMQGIGGALYEQFVYDGDGNPLSTTFMDYLLPTAAEAPVIEYGHVETPSDKPGGFRGMGEGGAIGSAPAVLNAIADALAPLCVTRIPQPASPSALLEAIAESVSWRSPTA